MPKKVVFHINGYRPAHSKAANDFLKACDLGIEGAFVREVFALEGKISDPATFDPQVAAAKIKTSLEDALGWTKVVIVPIVKEDTHE